jgi:hypothetical protein
VGAQAEAEPPAGVAAEANREAHHRGVAGGAETTSMAV